MDLRTVALPLYEAKGWIKLLGGALVALGILYALSIFGLPIAWLFLWLGVLLLRAARQIDGAFSQGQDIPLSVAFQKLRRFFMIASVGMLVYVILVAVVLVVWVVALL